MRTSHINEWLTDERVQEIMVNIQTVVRQGARDSKADAIVAIGDALNGAQQGMDLAFTAGTLSTPAGVAREDSSRYAERLSVEDAKMAAVKARTYLKTNTRKIQSTIKG